MRESLQRICENFIHNRDVIKSVFGWDNQYIISVCASEFCSKNKLADADKLKECKKIVAKRTGIFSSFSGNVRVPMVSVLSCNDYPEQKMDKALEIYNVLKENFYGTEYLALLAVILTDMIPADMTEKYAVRGKNIYDLMRKEHPFITSYEDGVFAVLMAFSDKEENELIEDMENSYQLMRKVFSDRNALQSLTHVLALANGTPIEKCDRMLSIYHGLEKRGRKYGRSYELAVLGALSMLSTDTNGIIEDIIEVDKFLAEQKGYGIFGFEQKTRLMHAAMLVANEYSQKNNTGVATLAGTLAMIAAQEAALCAVIIASTVVMFN